MWTGLLSILLWWPWIIFVQGPLYIIQTLLKSGGIFDYLTTNALTNLIFGDFVKDPLNSQNLPRFFTTLSIVAVGLILIMFIMQLIIIQFTETHTIREKLGKAIKNTFLAVIVIIFIPFFFSLINYLIMGLLQVLKITSLGKDMSLADLLWGIGAPSEKAAKNAGSFGMPASEYITSWNYILEFVAIWFTLYVLFIASMTLVERIIDLLLLFSIAPIVSAMMPVDQGKRLGVWKEMVIGKFVIGPGTMLPIYIFLEILPKAIIDIRGTSGFTWLEKQLLYTLFCTAGAISCLRTQKIINHLVTQNLGVQSAIDSNGAGIASSIAGKARGFAALAAGGVGALNLGKQMLIGGKGDTQNPDGSVNKANGLLKNGIGGYGLKIAKGGLKGAGIGAAKMQNSYNDKTMLKDFGKTVVSPVVYPATKLATGIGKLAKEGWDGVSSSVRDGYNSTKRDN